MNTLTSIYEDIAARTAGDIYLGVVGPARTGKSTFIKRFMETLVLPSIDDDYRRQRARDELPQSGSGRTVMTAEPKFVPEEAVEIAMEGGGTFSVRLVDCVGYLVPGAVGQLEDGEPRMVHTPWFPQEIPMAEAAEIGTRKVIAEHATIGIVITTDGTITDLPREAYPEAEGRVIEELKALGKPFLILLNSAHPQGEAAQKLRAKLAEQYDVTCLAVSCLDLDQQAVTEIIQAVLYEFPLEELQLFLPDWVETLPTEHPIRTALFQAIRAQAGKLVRIRDVKPAVAAMGQCELVTGASVTGMKLGSGCCQARLELPRSLFYDTLSQQTGFALHSDGELLALLERLAVVQAEHQKVAAAMEEVRATGYGIVIPEAEELELEQPEIIKQGGRYGVRLRAKAPSIHMIRADIETAVSPIVGNEKQSEDMVNYLLQEFEGDTSKIWQSNIFGKPIYTIAREGVEEKLSCLPTKAVSKLQETLQRVVNEGSGTLICIIL